MGRRRSKDNTSPPLPQDITTFPQPACTMPSTYPRIYQPAATFRDSGFFEPQNIVTKSHTEQDKDARWRTSFGELHPADILEEAEARYLALRNDYNTLYANHTNVFAEGTLLLTKYHELGGKLKATESSRDTLAEDKKVLEKLNREEQRKHGKTKEKLEYAEKYVEWRTREIEEMKQWYEETKGEHDAREEKVETQAAAIHRLNIAHEELTVKVDGQEVYLTALRSEARVLEKLNAELKNINIGQKRALASAEHKLLDLKSIESQNKALVCERIRLQSSHKSLQDRFDAARTEAKTWRKQAERAEKNIKGIEPAERVLLREVIADLREKQEEARNEHGAVVSKLEQEKSVAQDKLAKANALLEMLRTDSEKKQARLAAQVTALEAEKTAAVVDADALSTELDTAQTDKLTLELERDMADDAFAERIEDLEAQHAAAIAILQAKHKQELQKQRETLKAAHIAATENAKTGCKTQLDKVKADLKQQKDLYKADFADIAEEVNRLETKVAVARADAAGHETANASLVSLVLPLARQLSVSCRTLALVRSREGAQAVVAAGPSNDGHDDSSDIAPAATIGEGYTGDDEAKREDESDDPAPEGDDGNGKGDSEDASGSSDEANLENVITDLKHQNNDLSAELDTQRILHASTKNNLATVTTQLATEKSAKLAAIDQRNRFKKTIDELNTRIEATLASEQQTYEDLEEERREHLREIRKLEGEKDNLREEIKDLEDSNDDLMEDLRELGDKLDQRSAEYEALEKEKDKQNAQYVEQLDGLGEEIDTLKEDIKDLQESNDLLGSMEAEARENLEELQGQHTKLGKELEEAKKQTIKESKTPSIEEKPVTSSVSDEGGD